MSTKRILICDDNPHQYQTLKAILDKRYEVYPCTHYNHIDEAIVQYGPIQLLILDLHYRVDSVEEYGGHKALPRICEKHPALQIVLFSKVLIEPKNNRKALEIARDVLRYKQVSAFLSPADSSARVEFEIGKAVGGPKWLREEEIVLLHLSDLQFGGEGLPGNAKTLAAQVAEALQSFIEGETYKGEDKKRRFPDLVLISGDLTQHGRPTEFEEASSFVTDLSATINDRSREMAGLVGSRNVILIPGNHDVNWDILRGRSIFSDAEGLQYRPELKPDKGLEFLWREAWAPYCEFSRALLNRAAEWVWDPGYSVIDLQKEIGVIFVCVNSARWGVTHLGQKGAVNHSTWLTIQAQLNALDPVKKATRVLLVHHSLHPSVKKENRLLLAESEDEPEQLVDLLKKGCNIAVVMTGHIHELAAQELVGGDASKKLIHVGAGTARSKDTKLFCNPQFSVLRLCELDPHVNKFKHLDVYPFQWDGKRFAAHAAFQYGQKIWQRFELGL